MPNFTMPKEMAALPSEQQEAIRQVLIDSGLITESGKLASLESHQKGDIDILASNNGKCTVIRKLEELAVITCAEITYGPIAVAMCVALVHEIANEICNS